MSNPKCPRTYYGYQSGITGFCYLVWHSEANDCDVPAPEGDYVRESDYAELRAERDELQHAFDAQWDAISNAVEQWRKDTGNDCVLPDTRRLVRWLLDERDRLRDVLEKIADGQDGTGWRIQSTGYAENVQRMAREALREESNENI